MTQDQVKLIDKKVAQLLEDVQASERAMTAKALENGMPPEHAAATARLTLWPGILSAVSLWRQAEAVSGAVDALGGLMFSAGPQIFKTGSSLEQQLHCLVDSVASIANAYGEEGEDAAE